MDNLIQQLLEKDKAKNIISGILQNTNSWEDGKNTAGTHAAEKKNNHQLKRYSDISIKNSEEIIKILNSDPLIKSFSIPRKFHSLMFTRTGQSEGYGLHVDNPYMSTGRSDLSFTLFLNQPSSYSGGALSIQNNQESKNIKLNQGQIIVYPSTSLHSVEQVRSGFRLACVGWIQSYVSSNEDRNILFGLDSGARALRAVMEECLMDLMYKVPEMPGIEKLTITKDFILGDAKPRFDQIAKKKSA